MVIISLHNGITPNKMIEVVATPRIEAPVHAQRERFRFIEASLLWEGAIRRQRVSEVFNVSLNHVTKDLRRYEAAYPGNITFDHRRQHYVPGKRFRPHFASRDPGEYLALQLAHAESGTTTVTPLLGGWEAVPVTAVPTPPHGVEEGVLRAIVRAIASQRGVEVRYYSTRGSEPGQRRLWPHAIVHTGVRWHVRAYEPESGSFRNFALQRMEAPKPINTKCAVLAEQDTDWFTSMRVKVVPNPKLNPHQKRLVARDFGMAETKRGYEWSVSLRRCLISYFVQKYGLDRKKGQPSGQRIVLANEEEIRPWLSFESD